MQKSQQEDIRFIETLAANAWRPAVEQHLDGWRLRVTGGSSSRVNSVWPNHLHGSLSLDERLVMVEDFYRRHKMPACFQMCSAALPENLASVLAARGYRDEKHTAVMTSPIEEVLSLTQPAQVIPVEGGSLSEAWFQAYTTASGYNEESLPFRRGILTRIGPAANFLLLEVDGKPAAVGLGVIERGWMGVFCVVTFPDLRRQGLAMQVMHALAVWGKTSGVDQVYLQVMLDNLPAIGLYDRLGFQRMYTYHYAVKPSI